MVFAWLWMLMSAAVRLLVEQLAPRYRRQSLRTELLNADQSNEAGIIAQRERVKALREKLAGLGIA